MKNAAHREMSGVFLCIQFKHPNSCGSGLARESGVSVHTNTD